MRGVMTVREGGAGDDAAIRDLLRRVPVPGAVSIAFTREPRYFDAIDVEGHAPRVAVAEREGRIVGIGLSARRTVFLNGVPREIGYLGTLRLDPSAKGTTALARGYALLGRLNEGGRGVPFHLTVIMEENLPALRLLTGGRAALPEYREIGRYRTLCIPIVRRRAARFPRGLEILRGAALGPEALARFLREVGRRRQLYPVYTGSDIASPAGPLRGLAEDDFLVAVRGGEPVGALACWDQSAFRQSLAVGYSPPLRAVRNVVNPLGRLLGLPILPAPGGAVACVLGACVAVRDDDPRVFDVLLARALGEVALTRRGWFILGMAEGDPLLTTARRRLHLCLRSRVYAVTWGGEDEGPAVALDGRPLYMEVGSL